MQLHPQSFRNQMLGTLLEKADLQGYLTSEDIAVAFPCIGCGGRRYAGHLSLG